MSSKTLLELRTALQRAGGFYPPQFETGELDVIINQSIVNYQIRMTQIDKDRIATLDDSSVAPSAGDATTTLPTDCEKVLLIAVADSQAPLGWTRLERMNADELYEYVGSVGVDKREVQYAVLNRIIQWWPKASGDAIRLVYVQALTELTDDAHTYDPGISGWDRWVTADAAIVCTPKIDGDPRTWLAVKEAADARLVWQAKFDHQPRRLAGAAPARPIRGRFRTG